MEVLADLYNKIGEKKLSVIILEKLFRKLDKEKEEGSIKKKKYIFEKLYGIYKEINEDYKSVDLEHALKNLKIKSKFIYL